MISEAKGLRLAAGMTMATGLALALATVPSFNPPLRLLTDVLVWPLDGSQTLAAPETRLVLGIGGGVLLGWGLMIWQLAGEPVQRALEAVRGIVRASALGWFLVDGAGSVAAVAALNILPKLVFLVLFLLPLRRTRAAVVG